MGEVDVEAGAGAEGFLGGGVDLGFEGEGGPRGFQELIRIVFLLIFFILLLQPFFLLTSLILLITNWRAFTTLLRASTIIQPLKTEPNLAFLSRRSRHSTHPYSRLFRIRVLLFI